MIQEHRKTEWIPCSLFSLCGTILEHYGCVSQRHVDAGDQDVRAQHAHAADRDVGGAALEVDELAEQGVSVLGGRVAALVEGEKGVLQRAVLRGQALLWHMQRR